MSLRRPTKAFILAAGLGTRMRPLSLDLPKPLMPLWGKPILGRLIERLRAWGVRDVLINIHHEPGQILEYVRRDPVPGLRISLSFEPAILGTGGALRRAAWFLDQNPFWLVNSDIVADLDPTPLLRTFFEGRTIAALWMDDRRGPRTVRVEHGFVTQFTGGTQTFCGLHLVSPRILDFLPAEGFAGIIPAYERAMKRGERVAGVCAPGSFWADIGTPQQYLDAHREISPGRQRRGSLVAIGRGVTIEKGARIENAVIWDGARIRKNARIENAIVGRDADVAGPASYIVMRADRALDAAEQSAIRELGFEPSRASAIPVGPRGSARTFIRIAAGPAGRAGSRRVMLVRYTEQREENALHAGHARFLARRGLSVPAVLLDRPIDRLCLVEDVGDRSLQAAVPGMPSAAILDTYRRVLDQIARLHSRGAAAARRARLRLMAPFSPELYRWERDFFATQFLAGRLHAARPQIEAIRRELALVAGRLQRAPHVLIHRDLQSSNILLRRGRPVFIDFQGMRLGPAVYDLASLLADPYVALPPALQDQLLDSYTRRSGHAQAIQDLFWWAVIERLAQALGAYARLSELPGMADFARHIPPAIEMMRRALEHVDGLPALRKWAETVPAERH
jgi:N-acetylmuramate 1-kinase